jgi:hypothetical protein
LSDSGDCGEFARILCARLFPYSSSTSSKKNPRRSGDLFRALSAERSIRQCFAFRIEASKLDRERA